MGWLLVIAVTFFIGCTSETKSLNVSPRSVDFGTVYIGDMIEINVTLKNKYSKEMVITVLTVDGTNDIIITSGGSLPIILDKNEEKTITLKFEPTTDGIISGTLTIGHDLSGKPKTVDLTGVGMKVARIEMLERSYDFQKVLNNKGKTHDFEVTNIGTDDLMLTSFNFTGSGASVFSISAGGSVPVSIVPGAKHVFTVQMLPLVNGSYSATLQIDHNAANEISPIPITLDGLGVDVDPQITLSIGTSWDFGSVATTLPSTQICEISNTGTDPLTVSSATLLTSAEFIIDSFTDSIGNPVNLPQIIPVGGIVKMLIKFSPSAKITFNDTLTIVHDGTNQAQPWDVSLSGVGRDAITKTFDVVTKTIDSWTVPAGVSMLRIEVWGAEGGGTGWGTPGKGARMRGDFMVTPGDVIKLAVGDNGETGGKGGGGGGGSFVVSNSQPMIIAGGGGGSHYNNQGLDGKDGVTAQTCTPHPSTGSSYTSGSGGGWSADGSAGDKGCTGGKSWTNGLIGGLKNTTLSYHWSNGDGGFGGGGGGCWAPGSGGGYNGGVSATSGGNQTPGGTGGGSINNGTNQDNTSGAQTGHGKIVITY